MAQIRWLGCCVLCLATTTGCGGATTSGVGSAGSSALGGATALGTQGGSPTGGSSAVTLPTSSGGFGNAPTSSGGFGNAPTSSGGVGAGATNPSNAGSTGVSPSGGAAGSSTTFPVYVPPDGTQISAASTGFETGVSQWSKVTGPSGVRVVTDASAGEGSTYLTVDGATRTGGWDGPAVDILPYISLGRTYELTAAVRISPKDPVTAPRFIQMSVATHCPERADAATFSLLVTMPTGNTWARLRSTFAPKLPKGCSGVSKVIVYVETSEADKALSLDVDDFQVWDVTPPDGAGGASNQGVAGGAGFGH